MAFNTPPIFRCILGVITLRSNLISRVAWSVCCLSMYFLGFIFYLPFSLLCIPRSLSFTCCMPLVYSSTLVVSLCVCWCCPSRTYIAPLVWVPSAVILAVLVNLLLLWLLPLLGCILGSGQHECFGSAWCLFFFSLVPSISQGPQLTAFIISVACAHSY